MDPVTVRDLLPRFAVGLVIAIAAGVGLLVLERFDGPAGFLSGNVASTGG